MTIVQLDSILNKKGHMRYLSIDIEATGLEKDDFIIEFAAIPIDGEKREIKEELSFHSLIKCPSYTSLKPRLSDWVKENNKELIGLAHKQGISLERFKTSLQNYLEDPKITEFFYRDPITLFGKSLNAIDLPFLNRDLSWEFMRKYFSHRTNDLSSFVYNLVDSKKLPEACISGSELMKHLQMGEVAHTALEDARNTAIAYFKLLDLIGKKG